MYIQAKNWQTVKEILRDILRIEPSKRGEFLEKTETTAEIRREVESLLACEIESANFMSLPLTDFSKDFLAVEEPEISLVGQKIGIYEIVKEIGTGGMGAVYLADRADGKFEQKVAIKLLRRAFNTEKIRRYFRREREIQAKLNHPNIARLLDAGTTGDGVPFLVMEYIEGLPIDKFCETNNLSLDSRLKLFNRACDAVMHAHRNLTVHLDLKPSNILVTSDGTPKLLDFGISKLLDANETGGSQPMTILGAMTPEYASPEQIKGEPLTTAADIYSLGVVLFKILTGSYPYDFKGKTNGNLLKEITDSEPFRPSAVAGAAGGKANSKFQIPNPKSLAGDLDNIILKALSKEPERRYQTVEQFSADVWRYIDGLPVLARPATFSYRASKFYGRNKVQVLAGVFIIFSLIAGIAVALWQAKTANAQAQIAGEAQRRAEIETEKAKSEEAKAKKISDFMAKFISYANPAWYAEGGKTDGEAKVIDAVFEMSDRIEKEFPDHADIRAELHHKFGEIFFWYDRSPEANRPRSAEAGIKSDFHRRRALELRREFYGERHELVAKDLYYSWTLGYREGKSEEETAAVFAQAIQMMRETNPKNLNFPYMLSDYAHRLYSPYNENDKEMYLQMGRPLPAVEEKQEAFRRAALPPTGEDRYRLAERYLKEALPVFREHYKEDNRAIVAEECHLAFLLVKQNKPDEFDEHYRICRQGADKLDAESRKILFDRIENVTAGK